MVLSRWFTRNWADTDEPSHPDLRPLDLPLPPTQALERIRQLFQGKARWRVERIDGKPVASTAPSRWPWVRWKEAFWARLAPDQREPLFRTGPTWPNGGWLTLTRRTWMVRFIDDVLVWLEETPGGCRVHARSRSRIGRGDLGQNRRNLRGLFRTVDGLRRDG